MKLHKLTTTWRKYGAITLLLLLIIFINNDIIFGIIALLYLTVPCSIPYVNTHRWLWFIRQSVFLISGLTNILIGLC
jgi:hypothetical protein